MRKLIPVVTLCAAFGFACHRDSAKLQRNQEQYQVVQEGSTEGATSTINGPQEVRPPVATDTGADTTTAFTLPGAQGAPASTDTTGGSMASTLPNTVSPPLPGRPRTTTQTINATPATPMSSAAAPAPATAAAPAPQRQPRPRDERPAHTDTTASQPPATNTETGSTTTTQQPPANNTAPKTDTAKTDTTNTAKTDTTKTDDSTKKNDNPPPSDTSTSQPPPPPPPPMTDGVVADIHAERV